MDCYSRRHPKSISNQLADEHDWDTGWNWISASWKSIADFHILSMLSGLQMNTSNWILQKRRLPRTNAILNLILSDNFIHLIRISLNFIKKFSRVEHHTRFLNKFFKIKFIGKSSKFHMLWMCERSIKTQSSCVSRVIESLLAGNTKMAYILAVDTLTFAIQKIKKSTDCLLAKTASPIHSRKRNSSI